VSAGPIMIMAGGTGGHIFPGLAVAEALKARHTDVVWLGSEHGLEARLVPEAGLPLERISITGLRGRGWMAWLAAPLRLAIALVQAWRALRRRQPAVVLGLGGFVAGPGGLAAWLTGRPLLIHEQNAVAGSTNRVLARLARRVFAAFPDSFPPRVHAELIGNPVRASILALAPPRQRFAQRGSAPARLLILGGSQGARVLNRTLPSAIASLPAQVRPEIWHQAGAEAAPTQQAYGELGVTARVDAFISDMAAAYGWADLVVARAGALTLAELAAAGLGAVLVPFPHAVDDHQTANARHFVRAGAALLLPQDSLTAETLAQRLQGLLTDRPSLLGLAECAHGLAHADAAGVLAEACLATLGAAP
jgi:UDP-N-acetylglucosamine--N-acetylmuramyl-(pentapeptide) pyrophosphoryl-undecaprenol N-acetylglucosamine transferase